MCGIVGFFSWGKNAINISKDTLIEMGNTIEYRGPDEYGIYINQTATCGLVHKRLSIIGVSDGHQPMYSIDKNYVITFNGEIYNYLELRNELKTLGYLFNTNSDTEVILNAYIEWGSNCTIKLDGMFAFCIYDIINNDIFMARDRLGKKPFFYHYNDEKKFFIFSSEIKSILKYDKSISTENIQAIRDTMRYGASVGKETVFKNIYRLLPGNYSTLNNNGDFNHYVYWELMNKIKSDEYKNYTEKEILIEMDSLFRDSIKKRMISEVPIGAYLSGGVDSSLIVAIMSQISEKPINTFSVIFDDEKFNEEKYSDLVSLKYCTNHHKLKFTEKDLFESIPKWIEHMDDFVPQRDGLPRYIIANLVSKYNIRVMLSGSGADELFAGYYRHENWLKNISLRRKVKYIPKKLFRLIFIFFNKTLNFNQKNRYKRYLNILFNMSNKEINYYGETQYFTNESIDNLIIGDYNESMNDLNNYVRINSNENVGDLNKALIIDVLNRIPNDAMMREDRLNMASSIEGRLPILDYKFVEFAMSISDNYKIKNGVGKYIWKKYAELYLPKEILYREKIGFGYPLDKWLRKDLYLIANRMFKSDQIIPFINYSEVNKIWDNFNDFKYNEIGEIWTLFSLELWYRRWILDQNIDKMFIME